MGKVFGYIFYAYIFLAFIIFVPYFNYQYARDNGFIKWLILGEIIPTAKALVWPFYIIPSKEKSNVLHFNNSMKYSNLAASFLHGIETAGNNAAEEAIKVVGYCSKALEEARKVNIVLLNKALPTWGDHFQTDYIGGLETVLKGIAESDKAGMQKGSEMVNNYIFWYQEQKINMKNNN